MRILYVITEDWFLHSHFLERAKYASLAGAEIGVATRFSGFETELTALGFKLFPIEFSRRGLNPFIELKTALKLRRTIRNFQPDITHNIALKPVVTGTIGELLGGQRIIINALVGMGYVFTSSDSRASYLRPFISKILKILLKAKRVHVVIENSDDFNELVAEGFVRPEQISLIRGAGVNLDKFKMIDEPDGPIVITQVSRLLRDKGVREFIEAATTVLVEFPEVQFQLVGDPDPGNPTSIDQEEINSWSGASQISYLGRRNDVAELIAKSHIICLPSYREGLPKSLIEALSCGRPVITTDVPGCREVCNNNVNGILVPPKDSVALAMAIKQLIQAPALRKTMGKAGRNKAVSEFSNEMVCQQTLDLYKKLVNK